MINTILNFANPLKKCLLSGLALSFAWTALASFIYFDQLYNYPKSYNERLNLNLNDCFKWDDDFDRRDEALDYAKAHGNGVQAQMLLDCGLRFLKPVFSVSGFYTLVLLPIIIGWLALYTALYRRKYLVTVIAIGLIILTWNNFIGLLGLYFTFTFSIICALFLI